MGIKETFQGIKGECFVYETSRLCTRVNMPMPSAKELRDFSARRKRKSVNSLRKNRKSEMAPKMERTYGNSR